MEKILFDSYHVSLRAGLKVALFYTTVVVLFYKQPLHPYSGEPQYPFNSLITSFKITLEALA